MDTKLQPGYLLYRRKGFVQHAGVYLGAGQVLHNSPTNHVEIVSLTAFAGQQPVKVVQTGMDDSALLGERLEHILAADLRYNPATRNCEHIANFLLFGRKFSPQVQAALWSGIAAGLLSWRAGRGNPWVASIAGGILGCITRNGTRRYDARIATTAVADGEQPSALALTTV